MEQVLYCLICMTIGDFSKETGVPVETVRYYHRMGLLELPKKMKGAYRFYGDNDIEKLNCIVGLKKLGLNLKKIKFLMSMAEQEKAYPIILDVLQQRIQEIDSDVEKLSIQKTKLKDLMYHFNNYASAFCKVISKNTARLTP